MAKVSYTQTAFNGGEISPRMMGRTDFERYHIGLSLCENGIILPQGGATRRPGFQFIHAVKNSSYPVELVPFEFSEDQAYVLEFGDLYMRVYADGGIVVTPDAYTVLLLHGDGLDGTINILDDSPSNHTISVYGNAQVDTSSYKFSTGSLLFGGTTAYLSIADHANWAFGTGEWCVECWVNFASLTRIHTLFFQGDTHAGDFNWFYFDAPALELVYRCVDGGSVVVDLCTTWNPSTGVWYKLAVFRIANNWYLTIGGVVYDSELSLVATSPDQTAALQIGTGNTTLTTIYDTSATAAVLTSAGGATRSDTAAKTGLMSAYFDGTNDNFTAPDHASWDLATNHTIQFWVKHSDHSGNEGYIEHYQAAGEKWNLKHVHGAGLTFQLVTGATATIDLQPAVINSEITDTDWHHVLWQKEGSHYSIYLDGKCCTYVYDTSTATAFTGSLYIGQSHDAAAASEWFQGYIDDLVIDNTVISGLAPQSIVYDASTLNGYATRYSYPGFGYGTFFKFGTSSIRFDGSDDRLSYTASDNFNITNKTDSTIDFWIYMSDVSGTRSLATQYTDANNYWELSHIDGTGLQFYVITSGVPRLTIAGGEINASAWDHIALCKVGTEYGIYKNGTQVAYGTLTTYDLSAGTLHIASRAGANFFNGYMDELHITHGNFFSAAPNVGLSNTIVVPTAAHGVANAKLLMHFDAATFTPSINRYRPSNPRSGLLLHIASDSFYFNGRIDEVRITKGENRYSGTFTPETTEFPSAGGYEIYELVTEYTYDQVAELRVVQSADTLYICHPDMNVRKLTRTDHDNWTITSIDWSPPPWNEVNATAITLDPSATTGAGITITASAPFFDNTMIGCYFKQANGYYLITGVSNSTTATATVKDDLDDHVATATWYRSVWDLDQGYPTCATFHEDRLVLAGQREHPLTVYFSRTGDYEDMAQAASAADDPFDATIWSQQQNQIKWLVSGKRLFVGTVGSEFWMTGSTIDTPMAYNSIQAKPESSVGSEGIAPLVIDSTVVFVQDGGERVRLWSYNLSSDGYESNDLSILADHLTAYNPIYKIQYAQYPYSVLWATTYDGTLIGCTIVKNNNVLAWHHHYTGTTDTIETIAVIPGVNGDELWVVAARTIDGSVVQYVERLNDDFYGTAVEDGIFMDSAISYDGTPATSFSGADHLEGETVQVLADGVYIGTKTISSGAFTLTNAASVVHCGIPYNTNIETLPWNTGDDRMTAESSKKRIVNVMANVLETCELSFGKDGSNLLAYPMTNGTLYTQRFAQEHNGDWGYEPTIYFRQSYPFPMTLLSVTADVEIGGR